jgi:hypothetical protein
MKSMEATVKVSRTAEADESPGDVEARADGERQARVAEDGRRRCHHGARLIDLAGVDAVDPPEAADHVEEEARRIARDLGAAAVEEDLEDLALELPIGDLALAGRADVELPEQADQARAKYTAAVTRPRGTRSPK